MIYFFGNMSYYVARKLLSKYLDDDNNNSVT